MKTLEVTCRLYYSLDGERGTTHLTGLMALNTPVASALELFGLVMDCRQKTEAQPETRFVRLDVMVGKKRLLSVYEDWTGEETDEKVFEAWSEWQSYQEVLGVFHACGFKS